MDKSLGDIINFVKEKGMEKNTIIVFMNDNGGFSLAQPRGGNPFTHNLPLKAGKDSLYEVGIRVPMIEKWPGIAKPASICNQYIIIEDFFPTILKKAGIKSYKTVQQTDGKSFVSLLKNPLFKMLERDLVWYFPNKWIPDDGPGINFYSAIRKGKWKLLYNMRTRKKIIQPLK